MLLNCGVRENSWESLGLQGDPTSPSWRKSSLNIHWKDWCWSWSSKTLATWCEETHWKRPNAGKDWRREEKGTTEDEMAGWHHWLNGHEFDMRSWGYRESGTTERLNISKPFRLASFTHWHALRAPSCMSFYDLIAHLFLTLKAILLSGWTTACVSIHMPRSLLFALKFGQLWIKLLETSRCRFFCGRVFHFFG